MTRRPPMLAYDALSLWLGSSGPPASIPTGVDGFDRVLGGFVAGEVILLTGPPKSGKTALALDLVTSFAVTNAQRTSSGTGHAVPWGALFVTSDSSAVTLVERMAFATSRLPLGARTGGSELSAAADALALAPLWIDDAGFSSPRELADGVGDAIDSIRAETGVPVRLVVVDEIGPLSGPAVSLTALVHALKRVTMYPDATILLIQGHSGEEPPARTGCTEVHLALVTHEGEVRPRVIGSNRGSGFLPMRLSRAWLGFEDMPDPDADVLAERFRDPG